MTASLASFEATVERLIRRFKSDRNHYLSKNYSEAQERVDFISPFPYIGRSSTTQATKACRHCTQSAGLVATHGFTEDHHCDILVEESAHRSE